MRTETTMPLKSSTVAVCITAIALSTFSFDSSVLSQARDNTNSPKQQKTTEGTTSLVLYTSHLKNELTTEQISQIDEFFKSVERLRETHPKRPLYITISGDGNRQLKLLESNHLLDRIMEMTSSKFPKNGNFHVSGIYQHAKAQGRETPVGETFVLLASFQSPRLEPGQKQKASPHKK
jgi:hypothetical protein